MRRRHAARALLGAVLVIAAAGCAHRTAVPAELLAGPQGDGWLLLEQRCQSCHALPDPRRMTRTRWEAGLVKMRRRVPLPETVWAQLRVLAPGDSANSGDRARP